MTAAMTISTRCQGASLDLTLTQIFTVDGDETLMSVYQPPPRDSDSTFHFIFLPSGDKWVIYMWKFTFFSGVILQQETAARTWAAASTKATLPIQPQNFF